MKHILILAIISSFLYSKIIENKNNGIILNFNNKLYAKDGYELWQDLTIINKNTNKKITILWDKSEPIFSDDMKFSPDGQFLMYKTYMFDAMQQSEEIEYNFINCTVIDLYENRQFFDKPALSRCRSDWYDKEAHTLVNESVEYDENDKPYLENIYRIPKESFMADYKKITLDMKKQTFSYLKERFSLEIIKKYLNKVPLSAKKLTKYNNIAYYLEKAGAYQESIYLLEKIIEIYPNRIVAYINLGDAYLGNKQKDKAIKAYKKYIELMKQAGKEKKIPKRVLELVNDSKPLTQNTQPKPNIQKEEKTFFSKLLEWFGISQYNKNMSLMVS